MGGIFSSRVNPPPIVITCPLTECATDNSLSCVNLDIDPDNCGECGQRCSPGYSCQNGQCGLNCVSGFSACEGMCANLNTDEHNCGVCGFSCQPEQACVSGECVWSQLQQTKDQLEQDTCGGTCAANEVCTNGLCVPSCAPNLTLCPGNQCVDCGSDRVNCGACGAACDDGFLCSEGKCAAACLSGFQSCPGGLCVNVQSNAAHCGSCGSACQSGHACVNGACAQCGASSIMCKGACVAAGSGRVQTLQQFLAGDGIGVVGVSGVYNGTYIVTLQPMNYPDLAAEDVYQVFRLSLDGSTAPTPIGSRYRGNQDGVAAAAQFNNPRGLALDAQTGNVYVADMKNKAIRMIDVNNNVTTISSESNGLANPYSIAFYNGDLYVVDTGYNQLFKIEMSKSSAAAAQVEEFSSAEAPYVVGLDKLGFLYVTLLGDQFQNVLKLAPDGTRLGLLTSFSGAILPTALVVDDLFNVYVADGQGSTNGVYMVSQPSQQVTLIAGGGAAGSDDGVGVSARFDKPWALALTADNGLLVADWMNNSVRLITQC
jgi:DNA-binding beta-propeller fold protein YncE